MKKKFVFPLFIIIALLGVFIWKFKTEINSIKLPAFGPQNSETLLMPGSYKTDGSPLLLSINTNNFTVKNILGNLKNPGFNGIHEVRTIKEDGVEKFVFGTYLNPSVTITNSTDLSKNPTFEFTDKFAEGERVRAIETADLYGDGRTEIIAGTRPSGILKIYTRENGAWSGTVIDKVGATIHDIVAADTDADGKPEIFVSISTTDEAKLIKLPTRIPEVRRYTFVDGKWKKETIWKPTTPTIEKGVYNHSRYLFAGNFDGSDATEIVAGEKGTLSGTFNLILFKWNGKGYSQSTGKINTGVLLDQEIITSRDIDGDGIPEILTPSVSGDAVYIYKFLDGSWQRSFIKTDLFDLNPDKARIIALTAFGPLVNGYKKLLLVTVGEDGSESKIKFYVYTKNEKDNGWDKTTVNITDFPGIYAWGIFPM